MAGTGICSELPAGGFSFENTNRNAPILNGGRKVNLKKTGTTIVGAVFKGGVVLGADTRSTSGDTVAEKNCEKIHFMADNIYCCGAGTAADTQAVTEMIGSKLELLRLSTDRKPRVDSAKKMLHDHLFKHQGHISAALILGGVDPSGAHLYSIAPHGSVLANPYITMGSGSLAAMSVLEKVYKKDMTEEECKAAVCMAIKSGIFNDLGSGSNVDLRVITATKSEDLRGYEIANIKEQRVGRYVPRPGTTPVIDTKVRPITFEVTDTAVVRMET